jgi:hypothetical protein
MKDKTEQQTQKRDPAPSQPSGPYHLNVALKMQIEERISADHTITGLVLAIAGELDRTISLDMGDLHQRQPAAVAVDQTVEGEDYDGRVVDGDATDARLDDAAANRGNHHANGVHDERPALDPKVMSAVRQLSADLRQAVKNASGAGSRRI